MRNKRFFVALILFSLFLIGEYGGLKLIKYEKMQESSISYQKDIENCDVDENVPRGETKVVHLNSLTTKIQRYQRAEIISAKMTKFYNSKMYRAEQNEVSREETMTQDSDLQLKEINTLKTIVDDNWNMASDLLLLEGEFPLEKIAPLVEERMQEEIGEEVCKKISRYCQKYSMEEYYNDILKMIYFNKDVASEGAMNYQITLPEELQDYTLEVCEDYRIKNYLKTIFAIMYRESRFKINAINPECCAFGLMQIHIYNYRMFREEFGLTDLLDPYQNIQAGVHLFSMFIKKYEDVNMAIMAYGLGESGAQELWDEGIYETEYTKEIEEIIENLK